MESTLTTSRTRNIGAAPPRLSNATLVTAAGLAAVALTAARRAEAVPTATQPITLTFANPPANPGPAAAQIPGTGDIQVLNYALALEALEANLYVQALARLTELGVSTTDPAYVYVNTFAPVEANHRDFLANALGSAAITAPGQPLANATFDFGLAAMTNAGQVVQLLYTVEDTGTKAYIGAIPFFADSTYLAVAGGIQGTEARHTSTLAIVLRGEYNITTDDFGNVVETAPLAGNNNGIDPATYTPDFVLSKVSGPSGYIFVPAT